MNTTAGILAGLLVAGAAVTVYRFARRQADQLRAAIDEMRGANPGAGDVIDFEKDPETGVFRPRA
ncbi:MAG: hypothetical protein AB7F91_08325 [Parvularculaceae bacterium]|nr:hypothetical protein [Parvularculaceae bacterium]